MKIIDECLRKNIGILVTYIPFSATTTDQMAAASAEKIAAMYDVTCLNMLKEDIIDEASDLNDHGHLNVIGAEKVTDYVGNWLAGTGEMTDHREDERYSDYEDACENFSSEILEYIKNSSNLEEQLELINL